VVLGTALSTAIFILFKIIMAQISVELRFGVLTEDNILFLILECEDVQAGE